MALFCEYVSDRFRAIWPQFEETLKRNKTRDSYMYYVNGICNFCKCDFLDIDRKCACSYFSSLSHAKKKYSTKYLHSLLSGYRSIASYIISHKDTLGLEDYVNPFVDISLSDYTDQVHASDIPTIQQMKKILSTAKSTDPQLYLIFAFSFYCGLSISEILSITPDNIVIDQNDNVGICISKPSGDKKRYVKVPSLLLPDLEAFCNNLGTRSFLFANKNGRPLQTRTLQLSINRFMKTLCFSRIYTMQQIRNASVAYMRAAGAPLEDVASYTGISERWMHRYDGVIEELTFAPCDFIRITA